MKCLDTWAFLLAPDSSAPADPAAPSWLSAAHVYRREKGAAIYDPSHSLVSTRCRTGEGGYDIVKATSGEEALSITREANGSAPDLILMNIHRPGMDGASRSSVP